MTVSVGICLLAVMLLGGCATVLGFTGVGTRPASPVGTADSCAAEPRENLLRRWGEISGSLSMRIVGRSGAFDSGVLQLGSPTGVAASLDQVYILDSGHAQILRLDRNSQAVRQRIPVPGVDLRARISVDRSQSLYLTNPAVASVTQYDLDGRMLQTFASQSVLAEPVGLAVSDRDGSLYVADGLSARVVVFNAQGAVERIIGNQFEDSGEFLSVGDIALAPDQLFVVDQVARRVHLLSSAGRYRYAFGEEVLIDPQAVVVDRENRVYVADNGDKSIKIFQGGELLSVFGGPDNPERVRLGRVSGMWESDELLYVADTESVSIKIFRITAPCT